MVNNPLPSRMARILSADLLEITMTLGPPGDPDVFVTAADDVAEVSAAAEMARRLTLVDEAGDLIRGPLAVLEFDAPAKEVASPIRRSDPGFTGRGRTAGGAREFVIPNYRISELDHVHTRVIR
jgi:hypothetical protein